MTQLNDKISDLRTSNLVKIISDSGFAKKLHICGCASLAEVDEAFHQVRGLMEYADYLEECALENKARIASEIAEYWLPHELYLKIAAERESRQTEDISLIELDSIKEAVQRVRSLVFVENSPEVSFKNVICTDVVLRDDEMLSDVRLIATFSYQDKKSLSAGLPDFTKHGIRVSVPFGKTTKVCNSEVHGGINVGLVDGRDAWHVTTIFEDAYELDLIQDALAKTLGTGDVLKLGKYIQEREEEMPCGLDSTNYYVYYTPHESRSWVVPCRYNATEWSRS